MSLGFEPSVGQILPNQTGKTKDSKQEEEFPIRHHRAENSRLSRISLCAATLTFPHMEQQATKHILKVCGWIT